MIEVKNISKSFGEITALENISFVADKGEIVGFLGANGAGKTTTMDIICGCLGADSGSVEIAGHDILKEPLIAKRKLGYLPDIPPLYPEMKVRDAITYVAKLNKVDRTNLSKYVGDTIDELSLGDVSYRLVGNLSKGYRQRVAFAQALVHKPEVLILDEPTEGLDPNQIIQIRDLIRSLKGERTIMLSSHILSEVSNTCDTIIIIHQGKIVQKGTYEDLIQGVGSGHLYHLKVGRNSRDLVGAISGLTGISSPALVESEDHSVEFVVKSDSTGEALDAVAKAVVEGGYGLRELTLKTKSLEEVFFQITK